MQYIVGIDIGGTKIAAALVRRNGGCELFREVATPVSDGPLAIMNAVMDLTRVLLEAAARRGWDIVGIGIGTAGQINTQTGIVTYAVDTIPGWAGTEIADQICDRFGLKVAVENDVNAMAIAEMQFGAGHNLQSALYVGVGTGIGGALILDGRLWHGAHWSAGELGHMVAAWDGDRMCNCGQAGHLEAYAAGPAIARRYCQLAGWPESPDLRAVASAAAKGDRLAIQAIAEGAHILGVVLAGLVDVFDPQALIVGGGVAQLDDIWWMPFEQALRANPLPAAKGVKIRRSQLGNQAVVVGAAWLTWEKVT
jgi:glucokinase